MGDDARLFLQIRNSINSEIVGLLNHCEFVKELMDYLEFLYSGKVNMSWMYDVCKSFFRAEKEAKSLNTYFMEFKKTYEELNVLLPFSTNIKVQQTQREKMVVMSFLVGFPLELETAKLQILSSPKMAHFKKFLVEFCILKYQESLKISTPDTTHTKTGKTCLFSSSNEWVIDSGATDHMTGLPTLAFNLIYAGKLTKDLNCCILFFSDYCISQDLMTKKILGK
ncbi:hypothetical protein SADUNF_Sadunf11G0020600 [Salix dunnii]|uniref:Uncharacterized protein n=1 Tax=Salix dunnii TaxID=1413687 RepID=A0A835JJ81_9ROSI|nr:hypothetical protein SADUNF_Sadunf11G0020600 [Salix dunnii]